VDPGQSTVRLDLPIVTVGVSTANQHWGPATWHPIILGNNAAGFPHLFLGTSRPLDLWAVKLHGRVVWGDLRQSDYTANAPPRDRRFMSGIVGVMTVRGVEGLEIGASRFFHEVWPDSGLRWRHFTKPFESFLKFGLGTEDGDSAAPRPRQSPDNQLAAVFFRWTFPESGLEVYGEYGREDHNINVRDLILEPDHDGGLLLGLRKTWGDGQGALWGIRAERLDLQVSQLIRGRLQMPFYRHGSTRQGHTNRGQILGAEFGNGGSATTLALDRYHRSGRWSVSYGRYLRQDNGGFWVTGVREPNQWDVIHALGGEVVLFRGPLELSGGLTAMYELNRHLGDDAFNVNAWAGVRAGLGSLRQRRLETGDVQAAGRPRAGARDRNGAGDRGVRDSTVVPPATLAVTSGRETEHERMEQILGWAPTEGYLIRSVSSRLPRLSAERSSLRVAGLELRAELVDNSDLPFSLNDGSMWAGRGTNTKLSAGFRADWGPLTLIAAPEVVSSENLPFPMPDPRRFPQAIPPSRDSLASPWYVKPGSIDQPVRFGEEGFVKVYPGQTTLQVTGGPVTGGFSTENQWWGPGLRNAIVMSDNAPGFPHVFVRTTRPLRTPVGAIEGKWLVGGLSESDYFDDDPANDVRSLSALAVAWTPQWTSGLTLGFTRAVYRPVSGGGEVPLRFFDAVFSRPGRPNDREPTDSSQTPGPDQIFSLFGRWVFPRSGVEVYGEWARTEFPASLRHFLEAPATTQGYTFGLQWAKPLGHAHHPPAIRLQAEHTYLEKGTSFRHRPIGTYYTSRAAVQGYTNEGQVLGAALGPGGSGQWLAVDFVAPRWEIGVFGGRIRWENDALYETRQLDPFFSPWCQHDVSLWAGVRAAYDGRIGRVEASVSRGRRFNLFFRYDTYCGLDEPDPELLTDVDNTTLQFRYAVPLSRP
jgi:hypothetical protein